MDKEIKKDILSVLSLAKEHIRTRNASALRELSDHTIHNSSIFQDKDSITIAVVIYSLSKIIDRQVEVTELAGLLSCAHVSLEADDMKAYEDCLENLVSIVSQYDKKMDLYVKHILGQAGIKKGSRIYEHGISLARAAEIFNISQWELMRYLGQTNIAESFPASERELSGRIMHARKIFGVVR